MGGDLRRPRGSVADPLIPPLADSQAHSSISVCHHSLTWYTSDIRPVVSRLRLPDAVNLFYVVKHLFQCRAVGSPAMTSLV